MTRDEELRRAYLAGFRAACARWPAWRNPHDDFRLGSAWALGWHVQRGFVPELLLEQARVAGVPLNWLQWPRAAA